MREKKESRFTQKALVIAEEVGSEVHLKSVRDAFLLTIPFLVLSGFMVFIAWVLLAEGSFVAAHLPANVVAAVTTICSKTINGGQNILALFMVIMTSYNLAKYKHYPQPLIPAVVSLGALFILMPSVYASWHLRHVRKHDYGSSGYRSLPGPAQGGQAAD